MDGTLIENALSAAGLAVLVLDEADRVIEASPPAARLLGCAPSQLVGRPMAEFLPLAPIKSLAMDPAQVRPPGLPIMMSALNEGNRALPLAVNAVRWTDPDGRHLTTVFLRDLALEREVARITHNQLVQSDNAIQGANIGVFEYDPNTQQVTVSGIWLKMLELDPAERIDVQQEWRTRVHPDDLAAALQPIRQCTQNQAERASCEYRLRSRDATHWKWMRTDIAVAQRDSAGRPSLLVGAQTDISERKATEDALRVSLEQFRSAFHHTPIGKAIVGLDGTHRMVNGALCALLGYSEKEMLSTDFQNLSHPEDLKEDLSQLALLLEGKIDSYSLEKRYFRADGSIMWGLLSVGLVRNAEGMPDHLVSQVVDITEQRRLEELKTEFVSVVSHELRTPLTSILGALSLLEINDGSELSDDVQRLLFIAKTNGERLHHLVNDILDFQKFSAKEMRLSLSANLVARLVDDTLIANLVAADKHGVRFVTQINDRSLIGLVDPKGFCQVMANLLSNASKFAQPDSSIEVATEAVGSSIRISVSNVGEGIPESFRERVFKPFSQAASFSHRRSGGTGLGLSITKQIVEQMGGEIGFDSVPGGRTTFWFTVQAAESPL
jgi:PAS domain S-box-containing protein